MTEMTYIQSEEPTSLSQPVRPTTSAIEPENPVMTASLRSLSPSPDPFFHSGEEKAIAFRNDPTTPLESPDNIARLRSLSFYQIVIYCDDSGSMNAEHRFITQCEFVKQVVQITAQFRTSQDRSVQIRFINNHVPLSCMTISDVDLVFRDRFPAGGSRIGTSLRDRVLQPLVYGSLSRLDRPILVVIITDGCPSNEPPSTFKDAIMECGSKLLGAGHNTTTVLFNISQVGSDRTAAAFLRSLKGDEDISDVLYCSPDRIDDKLNELRATEGILQEWVLKILTAPIMKLSVPVAA